MYKNIWQTLDHNIRYKEQNYNCSCFAAAYQNLEANIRMPTDQWINYDDFYEDCLQKSLSFSLDEIPPPYDDLKLIFTNKILIQRTRFEFNNNITSNDLLSLKGIYGQAYIVAPVGLATSAHSSAFFCKKIQDIDHFVCLTTMSPYNRGGTDMYVRPCAAMDGTPLQLNVFAGLEFLGQTRAGRPVITPGALVSFT